MKTALLIIDVQTALVGEQPHDCAGFLAKVKALLARARAGGAEVLFVQHDGGAGDPLEQGGPGWQIHAEVAPLPGERVFEKRLPSAFKNTGLHRYLKEQGINHLVLVGMPTELGIDATCRSADDLGYVVTIPQGCTTTVDNEYLSGARAVEYYERHIWNGRFARVVPPDQVLFEG